MKIKHEKIKNMTAICIMNDTIVVTGHSDGVICVWNVTLENPLVKSWKGHDIEPYFKVATITKLLKIDENTVASGAYDCHIKLWNVGNGNLIKVLQDSGYITALQLRGKNEIVSSSVYNFNGHNSRVRVWDYHTGKNTSFCPDGKMLGSNEGSHRRCPIGTLVLDDQTIAFTTYNEALGGRAVVVWNPEKQTYVDYPVEHQQRIDSIVKSNNGFVTISGDLTLKLWFPPSTHSSFKTLSVIHTGELRELNSEQWVCLGTDRVSVFNKVSGQSAASFAVHSAYYPNATDGQDIWIRLDDSCIFKINMSHFLKFSAPFETDIHNYLFSACGSLVKQSYIDCELPQLGRLLLMENKMINSEIKDLKTVVYKLSSALKVSQQEHSQLVLQEAALREELEFLEKSPLDPLLLNAAVKGNLEKVKYLLALDANPNAKNKQGDSVILLSMQNNHYEVAKLLITQGVDLTGIDAKGNTLIETMALAVKIEMLALLIDQHSKIEGIAFLKQAYNKIAELLPDEVYGPVRKLLSDSMLKIAVKQGNLDEVSNVCRDFHADVNAQDTTKETALHKAAYFSYSKIVTFLLLQGAQTDIKDKYGLTAIQVASGDNQKCIVQLIQHFELLRCVQQGDCEPLKNLLVQYANLNLNTFSHEENTNLLVAAIKLANQNQRLEVLKLLLIHGACPNANVGDSTPLHYAVDEGDKLTIQMLIQAKTLKGNINKDGETAIEYARRTGKDRLADYMVKQFVLEKKGYNSNGFFEKKEDSKQEMAQNSCDMKI